MALFLNSIAINATTFPDNTTQVWKIESLRLSGNRIRWEFESDAEVFLLCQLLDLIASGGDKAAVIEAPFMPYGRQDKTVSNDSTFAINTLMKVLRSFEFDKLTTIDGHSQVDGIESVTPCQFIYEAVALTKSDAVCFPDLSLIHI